MALWANCVKRLFKTISLLHNPLQCMLAGFLDDLRPILREISEDFPLEPDALHLYSDYLLLRASSLFYHSSSSPFGLSAIVCSSAKSLETLMSGPYWLNKLGNVENLILLDVPEILVRFLRFLRFSRFTRRESIVYLLRNPKELAHRISV